MKLIKGSKYKNTSGKFVQFPLRLSDQFNWGPNEKIELLYQITAQGTNEKGYIVLNLDYVGFESCFETAWISNKCLKDNFTKLTVNQ